MSDLAVSMTVTQLEALIRRVVREEQVARDEVTYLTLAEAAKLLKLSTKTVLARIRKDGLPGERIGREWRFEKSKLVAFMRGDG